MSLETVRTVVSRFITDRRDGVLALRGPWGVGKTYAWNNLIQGNGYRRNAAISDLRGTDCRLYPLGSRFFDVPLPPAFAEALLR